jgi:hypothetical protein
MPTFPMYRFEALGMDLCAFSTDKTGANIPPYNGRYIWLLRDTIEHAQHLYDWDPQQLQVLLHDLTTLGFHLFKDDDSHS